ncbi:unnamed protein product [Choristocarpus tenellus]
MRIGVALLTFLCCAHNASSFLAGGGFRGSPNMNRMPQAKSMSMVSDAKVPESVTRTVAAFILGASLLCAGSPSLADGGTKRFSLPPISDSPDRCTFKSSAMGQANAARDKLYDLRECKLSGLSAAGFDLSGVIASEADFSKTDFKEVTMSKAYARNSNFDGADFTNAVVDRVSFDGSSMQGTIFTNAVLTSTSFTDANIENADFTEAYMGDFDQKNLCKNPSLQGKNPVTGASTRESAGCPSK